MKNSSCLVFVPTYNEAGNVKNLYEQIKKFAPGVDILFLDDNSPDGTGDIVDDIASKDPSVHAIHRYAKMGIGSAHSKAFEFATKNGYELLLTMDADFTHDPKYIPAILDSKESADIVIGSRYVKGGELTNWGRGRKLMTYSAHFMTKYCLGMPYDCTGAYRLYRLKKINSETINDIKSNGYSFFVESLYRFKKSGSRIAQVPIVAPIRNSGRSKISRKEIFRAARQVFVLMFDRAISFLDGIYKSKR